MRNQNTLPAIQQALTNDDAIKEVILYQGGDISNEKDYERGKKAALSIYREIERSAGTQFDLTKCELHSLRGCMMDAANFKLEIDNRKLAYIDARYDKNKGCMVANLAINANGFVAKIKERYPDAQFSSQPIFEGDKFKITGSADHKDYTYESTDPFADESKLKGVVISISYTNAKGKWIQDVQVVNRKDLLAMKAQSKSAAWNTYTIERMKTAAIKRAAKWHFRQDATLQELIEYDNKVSYDMEQTVPDQSSHHRSKIIDNLNNNAAAHREPSQEAQMEPEVQSQPEQEQTPPESAYGDIIDAEYTETPRDDSRYQELCQLGQQAANAGFDIYKEFAMNLSDQDKDLVRQHHQEWTQQARSVSVQMQNEQQQAQSNDDAPPL